MRGFTLIEILVATFIFSLIFIAVFMVLAGGKASFFTGDAAIEIHQEIRKVLLTMDKELRQSRSAVISGVPADDKFYDARIFPLTFKIPEDLDSDGDVIDASGNIEWSGDITYSLNANNQIIRMTSTSTSVIANSISNLQFMRASGNPDIVQINISTQKTTNLGRTLNDTFTYLIKMRN